MGWSIYLDVDTVMTTLSGVTTDVGDTPATEPK